MLLKKSGGEAVVRREGGQILIEIQDDGQVVVAVALHPKIAKQLGADLIASAVNQLCEGDQAPTEEGEDYGRIG